MHHLARALAATSLLLYAACESSQRPPIDTGNNGFFLPDVAVPLDAAPMDSGVTDEADADEPEPIPDAEVDSAPFEVIPYAVETRVGERRTPTGLENRVTCEVLNLLGEPIADQDPRVEVQPQTGFDRTEVGLVGRIARDYEIVCSAPNLGLRDATPAIWTVMPGAPARIVTRLSQDEIDAGADVEVTCEAYDADGNLTEDEDFGVRVDPPPAALVEGPGSLRFDSAGVFSVQCTLPGVEDAPPVPLSVWPDLPSNIAVSVFPERPVYRVGDVVEILAQVTDQYGNVVDDVDIEFSSDPALPGFGVGRFRCEREGDYALIARVVGPTRDEIALAGQRRIRVVYGGVGIGCDSPENGGIVAVPPGGVHQLVGSIANNEEVDTVEVDGAPFPVDQDGEWRADVHVEWGLNAHDVVAGAGEDLTTTFCAYYAADEFTDGESALESAAVLRLGQGAIDDDNGDNFIRSLGDTLRRLINSQGLVDTVHQAASAQNPIVPSECHVRVLGACLFRLGVEYTGSDIGGPNDLGLTVVDGGLNVRVQFREVNLRTQFRGTLGNRARFRAEHITFDLTFDVGLRWDGRPDVRLRNLNSVQVGDLDANFSGLLGFVFELVFEAFEGLVRRTVVNTIRDFLTGNIDQVLSDLFDNVDFPGLSEGFSVPSLVGGEPIPMSITAGLSELVFGDGRARFGVSAQVDAPLTLADGGPGMPLLPGHQAIVLPADRNLGVAVRLGLVNLVLYRLWRAGYFEAEDGGLVANLAAELPEGAEVFLRFPRQPWITGVDGASSLRAFVGPLSAGIRYPNFFEETTWVQVAAEIGVGVELGDAVGGARDISFRDVTVDRLYLSLSGAGIRLHPDARQILEDTLERILSGVINRALNDGLPVLPLPEFIIPDSLVEFDLPPGAALGLRQPRLQGTPAAWMLDGNFGE